MMNHLRNLAFKTRPLTGVIYEGLWKKPSVRMGVLKRDMMGETYEGTGKTTGYILNKKGVDVLCVDYITTQGFELTSGWKILGPTIFFPHAFLSWKIDNLHDINEDSLALFSILRPRIDCVFIGYGCKEDMTFPKFRELRILCKKMNLNAEILPTVDAITTFNFCSVDRRFVAAALIPPRKLVLSHDLKLISS